VLRSTHGQDVGGTREESEQQRVAAIDGTKLIAAIGQICLRKGLDVFLEAARIIAERRDDVHFLIVGERHSVKQESRDYEARLHALAERHLPGRVHWLGWRTDVARLLAELTLLVHTSRQEPLGRVLLESAAAGVPVVATDVGGTREIFPPESTAATIVPADDPAATARAALELLDESTRLAAMRAAGRRRAEEAFSIQRATAGLLNHYADVRSTDRGIVG
jgi:glycosyltransferase involved in cell wall biosynthesis